MIGSDETSSAVFDNMVNQRPDTNIDCFNSFDGSLENARMSDHIGVGKVQNHKIIFTRIDAFTRTACDLVRTHFRLQIICCNVR